MGGVDERACTKCQLVKPLAEFNRQTASRDGYAPWCRSCQAENNRALREKYRRESAAGLLDAEKRCLKCKVVKAAEEFYPDASRRGGLSNYCRPCTLKERRRYSDKLEADRLAGLRQPPEVKVCSSCQRSLSNTAFYSNLRTHDGLSPYCSECGSLRKLGLTFADYQRLLAAQDERCAVCGTQEQRGHGRFHVDHDHSCCPGRMKCGKCATGLVCSDCNMAMGNLDDDPELMERAAEYLENWQALR
jgi:hypothetical protein